MLGHFPKKCGLKKSNVLNISKIDLFTNPLKEKLLLKHGEVSNQPSLIFCIFGPRAWARIPIDKMKDLKPQSKECTCVGYLDGVKGYRLLDLSTKQLFIERSVYFDESPMLASQRQLTTISMLSPLTDLEDDGDNKN